MIQAVIFDMDGLLIDSEPLWRQAEEEIFQTVGVPLSEIKSTDTEGLRNDETVDFWYQRYPWESSGKNDIESRILARVRELLVRHVVAKEGVPDVIRLCEQLQLPMAIASSSSTALIRTVADKLGITNKLQVIHSAENDAKGKPDPAIYNATATELGVDSHRCVAIEDSLNGVMAAKAAHMRCIAVPESGADITKFTIADHVVGSLKDITADMLQSS